MDKNKKIYCPVGCYKDISKKKICACKKQKIEAAQLLSLDDVPKLTIKNLPF